MRPGDIIPPVTFICDTCERSFKVGVYSILDHAWVRFCPECRERSTKEPE